LTLLTKVIRTSYHQISWKSVLLFSSFCMSPGVQMTGWTDLIGVRQENEGAWKLIKFRRHFWPPSSALTTAGYFMSCMEHSV
jgi:hypothetical protein